MIWKRHNDIEALNANLKNTLCEITGMRVTKVTEMPSSEKCRSISAPISPWVFFTVVHPLHLAESLGSIAAIKRWKPSQFAVGLEITASHVAP